MFTNKKQRFKEGKRGRVNKPGEEVKGEKEEEVRKREINLIIPKCDAQITLQNVVLSTC